MWSEYEVKTLHLITGTSWSVEREGLDGDVDDAWHHG